MTFVEETIYIALLYSALLFYHETIRLNSQDGFNHVFSIVLEVKHF